MTFDRRRGGTRVASALVFALIAAALVLPGGSASVAAAPELVKDIKPGDTSFPGSLTDVGGTLFFGANDGSSGSELWKSDGTQVGTVRVKDINPGAASEATGTTSSPPPGARARAVPSRPRSR